ncbi:MAG: M48 family metalloprotease [Thermoleophilaceae bacterium]
MRVTGRAVLTAAGLVVLAAGWAIAAHALWKSSVPSNLKLPHLDQHAYFNQALLDRTSSFDAFLRVDQLLAAVALVVTVVIYARRGPALMRHSAAGPIGTGMLLGMLGLGIVWLVQLPFGLAELWTERQHDIARQGYVDYVVTNFLGLGGEFLFISFGLLVVMGAARFLRQWWWVAVVPAFAGLVLLFAFVSPFLQPDLHPLHNPQLAADARRLAGAESVPGTRVRVERVRRFTSAPNAEATGLGSSRRVVLWNTLLGGRFSRKEIDAVMAHELGHIAHHHVLKDVGWFALWAIPAGIVVALATRGRGGMRRPEAVPLALLLVVVLQLVATPLENLKTRHMEAEADWASLQTTRDPKAAVGLFQGLSRTALEQPNPPSWAYGLMADHPTIMQRIAMAKAWERR